MLADLASLASVYQHSVHPQGRHTSWIIGYPNPACATPAAHNHHCTKKRHSPTMEGACDDHDQDQGLCYNEFGQCDLLQRPSAQIHHPTGVSYDSAIVIPPLGDCVFHGNHKKYEGDNKLGYTTPEFYVRDSPWRILLARDGERWSTQFMFALGRYIDNQKEDLRNVVRRADVGGKSKIVPSSSSSSSWSRKRSPRPRKRRRYDADATQAADLLTLLLRRPLQSKQSSPSSTHP
jgi:hypothetical protein